MEAQNVTQIVKNFFEKLSVEIQSLEISQEEENIFYVKIQTPDSALIIGYSGKTLEDIRLILRNILSKISGNNTIIHLEINDYLIKKDEKLFEFIEKKIELLKKTGNAIVLPYFNSYDRKKIHAYIANLKDDTITSKSSGEGRERKITLCKKSEKLLKSIDLDAIDI